MKSVSILDSLNPMQREAAQIVDGPILILAGAGSGKTGCLTHRIAYLMGEGGVDPKNILAVTFTNKAANEMKERVEGLIGIAVKDMWIGTFHSMCARILRIEAEHVGYTRNFTIYDSDDQLSLVKKVMRNLGVPESQVHPSAARGRISRLKNSMIEAEDFESSATTYADEIIAKIYRQYQVSLRGNGAFDFDDLLLEPVRIFSEYPDILSKYQRKFRYILVDEYQDTNRPQYVLTKILVQKHRNICVVGDDDQSIYSFRGADLNNILDFEKDYQDVRVIRLEQNYRSTENILALGNAVVSNNKGRRGKELWTDKGKGERVGFLNCEDERDEGRRITGVIGDELSKNGRSLADFALLYRTNAQSRALEDAFRSAGIPYVIVGGVKFYERKEIKDALAYLRVIANPRDSVNLRRIINVPKRGIGDTTVERVETFALRNGLSLFEVLGRLDEIEELTSAARKRITDFKSMIEEFIARKEQVEMDILVRDVVSKTGYLDELRSEGTIEAESRTENVEELLSAVVNFSERRDDASLEAFLEEVSLITDIDRWDDQKDAVTMMTLHSAKGLEFPVVFITGLEDGLFPLSRNIEQGNDLEEERRLFYVGITRAKERLLLSAASRRSRFGNTLWSEPSRFLGEIPPDLIEGTVRIGKGEYLLEDDVNFKEYRSSDDVYTDLYDTSWLDVGKRVIHPDWGNGKVLKMSGRGEDMKLVVKFKSAEKRLLVKYAKLRPGEAV